MQINWHNIILSILAIALGILLSTIFQLLPQWAREYRMLVNYPYATFYGAIVAAILCVLGILWAAKKSAEWERKHNGHSKPDIRIDSSDIAKMNAEQLSVLKELMNKCDKDKQKQP